MSQHTAIQRKRQDMPEPSPQLGQAATPTPADLPYPAPRNIAFDFSQTPAYAPDVQRASAPAGGFSGVIMRSPLAGSTETSAEDEQAAAPEAPHQTVQQQCDITIQHATQMPSTLNQQVDTVLADPTLPLAQKVSQVGETIAMVTAELDLITSQLPQCVDLGTVPEIKGTLQATLL